MDFAKLEGGHRASSVFQGCYNPPQFTWGWGFEGSYWLGREMCSALLTTPRSSAGLCRTRKV